MTESRFSLRERLNQAGERSAAETAPLIMDLPFVYESLIPLSEWSRSFACEINEISHENVRQIFWRYTDYLWQTLKDIPDGEQRIAALAEFKQVILDLTVVAKGIPERVVVTFSELRMMEKIFSQTITAEAQGSSYLLPAGQLQFFTYLRSLR